MHYTNFRDVYHKLAIVLDNGYCFNTFNLMNPKTVPEGIEANSALVYGYIDSTCGLSYKVLGLTYYEDGDYTLIWPNEEIGLTVRGESFQNFEIIPIENKALAKRYAREIQITNECYQAGESLERTREFEELDSYRHEYFPDDVQVYIRNFDLKKQEQIWARLKSYAGKTEDGCLVFVASLLNEPFADIYGMHYNDEIYICLMYFKDGDTILAGLSKKQ